ncbi:MAG: helix-turn-helix transcriptional regulator [Steroidobacteraceae bacterium]
MPKTQLRPHSRLSRRALALLGRQIRLGRKARRMTAQELADRAGISRGLVQRIEKGDPGCQIGAVFEAAAIAGVQLFGADDATMSALIKDADMRLALLPKHTHPDRKVDDEFWDQGSRARGVRLDMAAAGKRPGRRR